jgi:hypothetical protein
MVLQMIELLDTPSETPLCYGIFNSFQNSLKIQIAKVHAKEEKLGDYCRVRAHNILNFCELLIVSYCR